MLEKNAVELGLESIEELSSTAILRRAYKSESSTAGRPTPEPTVPPTITAPATSGPVENVAASGGTNSPGEFTKYFEEDGRPEMPVSTPPNDPDPSSTQGEFTKFFGGEPGSQTERPVDPASTLHQSVSRLSPATSPISPARNKGFSTPGASDSASAMSNSNQSPYDAPARVFRMGSTSDDSISPLRYTTPKGKDSPPAFSAIGRFPGHGLEPPPIHTTTPPTLPPLPPYSGSATARPSEPSPGGIESETRLIQRLSQITAINTPETSSLGVTPSPMLPTANLALGSSAGGRSEFSRPSTIAVPGGIPATSEIPKPIATRLPLWETQPTLPSRLVVAEPPAMPAVPAAPASKKGTLESLAPMLLVINTFLLLLILLVLIFGLKK